VIGAATATAPDPNALLGHLRTIGVVVADDWAAEVRGLALDAGLVTPIPAAGVRGWRIDGDLTKWVDLIKQGIQSRRFAIPAQNAPHNRRFFFRHKDSKTRRFKRSSSLRVFVASFSCVDERNAPMAYGTLPNIANAGHESTPNERAEQIAQNLLKLPRSHFTVIDGTCGEGNLLAPFRGTTHAELIGIENNGKWAELAAERLPQAQIITAAIEHVTIAPNSISLAVLNPPYLVTNGGRMELQVFRQLCDAVMPHGVIACIIPARSAWDRRSRTAAATAIHAGQPRPPMRQAASAHPRR
jgi:hypothetical protein